MGYWVELARKSPFQKNPTAVLLNVHSMKVQPVASYPETVKKNGGIVAAFNLELEEFCCR
jgi:NAD-dependent SIR2 family protein deacetylase